MHALVIRYKSLHDCPYPMSPWMGSDHQPTLYLYYTPHTNTGFFLNLCLQFVQQLEKSISKLIIKVIVIIVTITISTRKKRGAKECVNVVVFIVLIVEDAPGRAGIWQGKAMEGRAPAQRLAAGWLFFIIGLYCLLALPCTHLHPFLSRHSHDNV